MSIHSRARPPIASLLDALVASAILLADLHFKIDNSAYLRSNDLRR